MDLTTLMKTLKDPSPAKTSQAPLVDPAEEAKKAASRRKAVETYKDLTSGQGFAGLSPSQIAKKLAARNELFKPEPIVFRPSYLLKRFPESAGRFFDALDYLYQLPRIIRSGNIMDKTSTNPKDWAALNDLYALNNSGLLSSPNIQVQSKERLPGIEIQMIPIDNKTGQKIFNGNDYRPAPIYVQDVQTWKESQDIQDHQIKGRAGAIHESEELFPESKTLKKFITELRGAENDLGVTDETTVVHLKTVLPIDSQDTFTAEFLPKIWHPKMFELGRHVNSTTSYKLSVIEGDKINRYQQLMGRESGREVHRTVPDENDPSKTKNYSWKPNYVPDMGELQKQLINDSKSRMIIIATPYELERPPVPPPPIFNFNGPNYYGSKSLMSASLGKVRVSQGSSAGEGSITDEELKKSEQESVIFVIDYLGIKPEDARRLKGSLK
jgi:hypothetical protein